MTSLLRHFATSLLVAGAMGVQYTAWASPEPEDASVDGVDPATWTDDQRIDARALWESWREALAPTASTVQTLELDGAAFRCVPFSEQPAFRKSEVRAALRAAVAYEHHAGSATPLTVESARAQAAAWALTQVDRPAPVSPPSVPPPDVDEPSVPNTEDGTVAAPMPTVQCPDGHVPIRVPSIAEIEAFGSLVGYSERATPGGDGHDDANERIHVTVFSTTDTLYFGTDADVNYWNPSVQGGGQQFSLLQTWVMGGSKNADNPNPDTQERIEIGVQKWGNKTHPELFLFTKYAPNDKCYEPCGDYVQTSTTPGQAPGRVFTSTSVTNGAQYFINLKVRQNSAGNWWVGTGSEWMGYYPISAFESSGLRPGAERIWWGGEVVNSKSTTTETDMGSGKFASSGFTQAAFLRNIRERHTITDARDYRVSSIGDVPGCSTGQEGTSAEPLGVSPGWSWGTYVFLGGPNFQPAAPGMCQP